MFKLGDTVELIETDTVGVVLTKVLKQLPEQNEYEIQPVGSGHFFLEPCKESKLKSSCISLIEPDEFVAPDAEKHKFQLGEWVVDMFTSLAGEIIEINLHYDGRKEYVIRDTTNTLYLFNERRLVRFDDLPDYKPKQGG